MDRADTERYVPLPRLLRALVVLPGLLTALVAPDAYAPAAHPPGLQTAAADIQLAALPDIGREREIAPAKADEISPPVQESAAARIVKVDEGDTLMGVLVDAGVPAGDAQDAISALKAVWDPRDLKVGQQIALQFAAERLQELRFAPAIDRDLIVARATGGHFASHVETRTLTRMPERAAGVIRTSLFEAASDAGVPLPVLAEMIHAFSYDVDFQREVQPNDSFEVLFERLYDETGKAVGSGEVAYASMTLSGKTLRIYRYTPKGAKFGDFFNAQGQSVRKALLRTPVDGARLSSRFGMRHHPILGYTKMHRGVDFAAPTGTPIMAAGDGVVEKAEHSSSYGNLVVLRHNSTFETAYAHMSRFARGTTRGQRVHQGQVIGYVGATGRATGPHLHYEVRIRGAAINPLSVKMQPGPRLTGKELVAFHAVAEAVDSQLPKLREAAIAVATPTRQAPE